MTKVISKSTTSSNTATVVQNDTATTGLHSIKLGKLRAATSVKVATTSHQTLAVNLTAMEQARISWETNELAASNKRLYVILAAAYRYYIEMKQDSVKDARKARAEELEQFIKDRHYTFMPSTHDMTRVVKCVFGVDRRRVSAYSIALREALRQEVAACDLVDFIEQEGGVEQIRLGSTKPLSVTKRAEKAKDEVLGTELGLFKFDPTVFAVDADWADKQVVIVATYLPTGEFQANAVLRHDSAVNSALAAYHSQQQAKERETAKAERDAEKTALAEFKKCAREQKKSATANKQKAVTAASKASATKKAAINATFETLFAAQ